MIGLIVRMVAYAKVSTLKAAELGVSTYLEEHQMQ
jgi:hypothetical protein